MTEIEILPGEKYGPFVIRREHMKKHNLRSVLEYILYLQAKHEDEEVVKHLDLGGGGYKRSRKRKTKKQRRRRTKHRFKKRRKTTRKKRGRGMGPSKIAKVGVGALAASAVMGQGTGYGISPSKGTDEVVKHFNTVACSDFHISDLAGHSQDHGQPFAHAAAATEAALGKKRTCKSTGQPMRNPNTGKPMSKKKQNRANKGRKKSRRRRQQSKKADANKRRRAQEKAKTRSKKADAKNDRKGEQTKNTGTNIIAGVGVATAAAAVAADIRRGRGPERTGRQSRSLTPDRREL